MEITIKTVRIGINEQEKNTPDKMDVNDPKQVVCYSIPNGRGFHNLGGDSHALKKDISSYDWK